MPEPSARTERKRRPRKDQPGDGIPMPAWLFYPLTLSTAAAAILLYRRGDTVAAFSLVAIVLCGGIGFRVGLARILASALGLFAAILYAPAIGMNYEQRFSDQFGTTGLINRMICVTAVGILISLLVTMVSTMISTRLLTKRRFLKAINSTTGMGCGIVEGLAITLLALGGLLTMQMWLRNDDARQNPVAMKVDQWASRTRQSILGPIVRDYNPFERIELLSRAEDIHQTARHLGDPKQVEQLLKSPRITQLRSDPQIAAAIKNVLDDPEIKPWMDQKRSLDKSILMRLMNSPDVLYLIDHPKFIPQIRQAIDSMETQ